MSSVPPRLFTHITSYFDRKGMTYDIPTDTTARVMIRGKNGMFPLMVRTREDEERVVVYSVSPVITSEERRIEMAIFLTLANYGIFIGNFELDMNDGEVRYKASQDVAGQPFTDDILARLIQVSANTFDQYAPGVKAVADGKMSAQEAIRSIEG